DPVVIMFHLLPVALAEDRRPARALFGEVAGRRVGDELHVIEEELALALALTDHAIETDQAGARAVLILEVKLAGRVVDPQQVVAKIARLVGCTVFVERRGPGRIPLDPRCPRGVRPGRRRRHGDQVPEIVVGITPDALVSPRPPRIGDAERADLADAELV